MPKPGKRIITLALFALTGASLCLAATAQEQGRQADGDISGEEKIRLLTPSHSAKRPFLALGTTNTLSRLDALQWAEDTADRLEFLLQRKLPMANRELRLVLREDPSQPAGWCEAGQQIQGQRLVQRLLIANYETTDLQPALAELCFLLLNASVTAPAENAAEPGQWSADALLKARPIPRWFSTGFAYDLYPVLKAGCMREAVARWQTGTLAGCQEILSKGPQRTLPASGSARDPRPVDAVACGALVAWILDGPNRGTFFDSMCRHLAEGSEITPEFLRRALLSSNASGSLNDAWDAWLLRQRKTVYTPGDTPPEALALLRAELLLYPGLSGIPLASNAVSALTLDFMIAQRDEAWVADTAKAKASRLRMLAIGRGTGFQKVVGLYCRFLEALNTKRRPGELERLLREARQAEKDLDMAMRRGAAPSDK
jgi:hypothetical protein